MARTARARTEDGGMNVIGPRAKQRREDLGITLDMTCARIAQATRGRWIPEARDLHKVETQLRIASDIEVLALAEALQCSVSWLLTGTK